MRSFLLIGVAGAMAVGLAAPGLGQANRFGPGPHVLRGADGMSMLRAADEDADRNVTRAELDGLSTQMFLWRDRNADGALDEADRSPLEQRLAAIREADGDDGAAVRRLRRGDAAGQPRAGADADEDGRVSQAEFVAAQARLFEAIDANVDGVLTPDELDAHVESRRNRGRWWRDR